VRCSLEGHSSPCYHLRSVENSVFSDGRVTCHVTSVEMTNYWEALLYRQKTRISSRKGLIFSLINDVVIHHG
jgi:hypothetical protein